MLSICEDPTDIARSLAGSSRCLRDCGAAANFLYHQHCMWNVSTAPPSTNQISECLPVTPMRNDLSVELNLHFAYYGCSQASLRMFKAHLGIYLCELSVHVFCQFFYLIFFPFPIFKCSLYIEKISPLFMTSFANHFSLACHLSLDSAYGSFCLAKNIFNMAECIHLSCIWILRLGGVTPIYISAFFYGA